MSKKSFKSVCFPKGSVDSRNARRSWPNTALLEALAPHNSPEWPMGGRGWHRPGIPQFLFSVFNPPPRPNSFFSLCFGSRSIPSTMPDNVAVYYFPPALRYMYNMYSFIRYGWRATHYSQEMPERNRLEQKIIDSPPQLYLYFTLNPISKAVWFGLETG